MKLGGLPFSCGLSLVCHAVAFGVYSYCGQVGRKAELRSGDLPLIINLVAAREPSSVHLATDASVASVAVPTPSLETPKLQLQREIPLEPLPGDIIAESVVTRLEPDVMSPPKASPTVVAVVTTASPNPAVVGDGSSQLSGLDRTRVQVQSGDRARADYRRNPKPPYPPAARRRHQEGLVLLSVNVTTQGRANRVVVKQSSGFTLLDEAALQTVRDWEFEPARIGPLAVESEIQVPIRFQLGN
jgi:periplasmic protein TonB